MPDRNEQKEERSVGQWGEALGREVVPALGCTEPGAVALAVARARDALGRGVSVESVDVRVSDSVFKNGRDVGVPGIRRARGSLAAAALGARCGDANAGLEALRACGADACRDAERWIAEGRVTVRRASEESGVFVEARVAGGGHEAVATIRGTHGIVTAVHRDGVCLHELPSAPPDRDATAAAFPGSFAEAYAVGDLGPEDVAHLLSGVGMNLAAAEAGRAGGQILAASLDALVRQGTMATDLGTQIRVACVAAAEHRMNGGMAPVMSSGGSGNAGIVAIVPVALVGFALACPDSILAAALAASHLTTAYIKARIGKLAPVCGCVVAAGSGAAAGICRLRGASVDVAAEAIRMLLSNSAGLFCDGAKQSCALKVGTAAHEAFLAAELALAGARIEGAQGLADACVEQTIDNVARINREGLAEVDRVMVAILEERAEAVGP